MGKINKYLLVCGLFTTILSTYICYSNGWANGSTESGKQAGYKAGYDEAVSAPNETAFVEGCNSGIQEVVRSVCNPRNEYQSFRNITFDELITFLKSDKTDEIQYSDNFTCSGYALTLKRNANNQGIKCAFVVLNYKSDYTGKTDSGHAINAFDIDAGPLPKIDRLGQLTFDDLKRMVKVGDLGMQLNYTGGGEKKWVILGRTLSDPIRYLTLEEANILNNYRDNSGIFYIDPQSDEIVYGLKEGKTFHGLSKRYIDQSGNLIFQEYQNPLLPWRSGLDAPLFQQLDENWKWDDRINKIELIW